ARHKSLMCMWQWLLVRTMRALRMNGINRTRLGLLSSPTVANMLQHAKRDLPVKTGSHISDVSNTSDFTHLPHTRMHTHEHTHTHTHTHTHFSTPQKHRHNLANNNLLFITNCQYDSYQY